MKKMLEQYEPLRQTRKSQRRNRIFSWKIFSAT